MATKNENQQSKVPSDFKKGLELHDNRRKSCCLPMTNKLIRKRKICQRKVFLHKFTVLHPLPFSFLQSVSCGHFSVMHMNPFVVHSTNVYNPLTCNFTS